MFACMCTFYVFACFFLFFFSFFALFLFCSFLTMLCSGEGEGSTEHEKGENWRIFYHYDRKDKFQT